MINIQMLRIKNKIKSMYNERERKRERQKDKKERPLTLFKLLFIVGVTRCLGTDNKLYLHN